MPGQFVIVRDARGSLVHVRNARTGECLGCIEVGLFEIVREVLREEFAATAGEGTPAAAANGRQGRPSEVNRGRDEWP